MTLALGCLDFSTRQFDKPCLKAITSVSALFASFYSEMCQYTFYPRVRKNFEL